MWYVLVHLFDNILEDFLRTISLPAILLLIFLRLLYVCLSQDECTVQVDLKSFNSMLFAESFLACLFSYCVL